ncbi:sigma-70 family RNA polymerase sigma factor [Streptomyces sp. NPDC051976]|uniref:sigma-70 family RNA polymerase sigma factor n=1 Tax=Streptomyces sp. NPDC051976 TaxID=3154947 RepID=UPI0034149FC5
MSAVRSGDLADLSGPSDLSGLSDEALTARLRPARDDGAAAASGGAVPEEAARALAELYRRHRADVLAGARRIAGVQSADDLTSEAFLRTVRAVRQGAGPTGSWRPYLLAVVRNTAAERAKAARAQVPLADFQTWCESLPDTTDPERVVLYSEETRLLARGFRSLPERWQAVLWHRLVDGRANTEVAGLLGLTPNGVTSLLARAQEGLRQAYLQAHIREGGDVECRHYSGLLGSAVRGANSRDRGLSRHLAECGRCATAFADLEHFNSRLRALAPFALLLGSGSALLLGARTTAATATAVTAASGKAATAASAGSAASAASAKGGGWLAAHPWWAGAAAAAVVGATAVSAVAPTGSSHPPATAAPAPRTPIAATLRPTPRPTPTTASPTRTTPTPGPAKPTHTPPPPATPADRLLSLLNARRHALGLHAVTKSAALTRSAHACAEKNLRQNTFEHCGYEVLYWGGSSAPETMMNLWFSDPPHEQALTHPTSRHAGAAIVTDSHGKVIAALAIDY